MIQDEQHSEESEFVFVETDEDVLGLAVVVQHHLVRLAPESALLVPSERGVGLWGGQQSITVSEQHTPTNHSIRTAQTDQSQHQNSTH